MSRSFVSRYGDLVAALTGSWLAGYTLYNALEGNNMLAGVNLAGACSSFYMNHRDSQQIQWRLDCYKIERAARILDRFKPTGEPEDGP